MKKNFRFWFYLFCGIILMGILVFATTTITNNQIIMDGNISSNNVNITKNLIVDGNITGNQIYADGWGHELGVITISSANVYYNVTNITVGDLNGFTFDGQNFTALVSGLYSINSGWSFGGTATNEYHISLIVNNDQQNSCHAQRKIGTGGDVGSAGFTCLYRLAINDIVQVAIENTNAGNDATIENINIHMVRIGD